MENEVHSDQHDTAPAQINFTSGSPNDHSKLSNRTSRSLTCNYKTSTSVTHPSKNIVTITTYPKQKYPIYLREEIEPHVTKPNYKGLDNFHTKFSHGENIYSR